MIRGDLPSAVGFRVVLDLKNLAAHVGCPFSQIRKKVSGTIESDRPLHMS
jgi:hypothetical protein